MSPTPSTQPGPGPVDSQQVKSDMVQSDVQVMKMSSAPIPVIGTHWKAKYMNTKVPRFCDDTCWNQHRQVSVKSNGWDDDIAALQLLTHWGGGGALNIALLVSEMQRGTQSGSPGRLVDYRRRFERAVRWDGEDPSIFATEIETLAVRAFSDVGPSVRIRMIRDRFVTGHRDCDLRRHIDSVPPDTPIREIVGESLECERSQLCSTDLDRGSVDTGLVELIAAGKATPQVG